MRQPTEVFRQDGRKLQWSVGTRGRHAKGRQILHLYLSRAYWRMCADHPVELPANDGCMEARPGSCHRQYGSAEMRARNPSQREDRKSIVEGKSVSVSVSLGGRGVIKKQKKNITKNT